MIKELAFIGVFILYTLFVLIILVIEKFRWYRKIEYLQSLGFKRYFFYAKPIYLYQYFKNSRFGWYYDNGTKSGIRIFDEELNEISYKKLKERFPSIEEIWKQSQPNAIENQNRYEV